MIQGCITVNGTTTACASLILDTGCGLEAVMSEDFAAQLDPVLHPRTTRHCSGTYADGSTRWQSPCSIGSDLRLKLSRLGLPDRLIRVTAAVMTAIATDILVGWLTKELSRRSYKSTHGSGRSRIHGSAQRSDDSDRGSQSDNSG